MVERGILLATRESEQKLSAWEAENPNASAVDKAKFIESLVVKKYPRTEGEAYLAFCRSSPSPTEEEKIARLCTLTAVEDREYTMRELRFGSAPQRVIDQFYIWMEKTNPTSREISKKLWAMFHQYKNTISRESIAVNLSTAAYISHFNDTVSGVDVFDRFFDNMIYQITELHQSQKNQDITLDGKKLVEVSADKIESLALTLVKRVRKDVIVKLRREIGDMHKLDLSFENGTLSGICYGEGEDSQGSGKTKLVLELAEDLSVYFTSDKSPRCVLKSDLTTSIF